MDYLVTGYPRTRTAWLASLMGAYHDVKSVPAGYGLCNPEIACLSPEAVDCPVVVLLRSKSEARRSLERWASIKTTDAFWRRLSANVDRFIELNPDALVLHSNQLANSGVVVALAKHCGVDVDPAYVDNFQQRYISEIPNGPSDTPKAQVRRIGVSERDRQHSGYMEPVHRTNRLTFVTPPGGG